MVSIIFTPKGRTRLLYAALGLTITSITGCASSNTADETAAIPFEADASLTVEESEKSDSANSAPAALPVVADCSTFGSWGSYGIRTDEIFLNSLPPCDMNGLGDVMRISEWET
jgi:hypothetical protein